MVNDGSNFSWSRNHYSDDCIEQIINTRKNLGLKLQGNKCVGMRSNRTKGITLFIWITGRILEVLPPSKVFLKQRWPKAELLKRWQYPDYTPERSLPVSVRSSSQCYLLNGKSVMPCSQNFPLLYLWVKHMDVGNRCSVVPRLKSSLQGGLQGSSTLPLLDWSFSIHITSSLLGSDVYYLDALHGTWYLLLVSWRNLKFPLQKQNLLKT